LQDPEEPMTVDLGQLFSRAASSPRGGREDIALAG
jgi:hypothetical protein